MAGIDTVPEHHRDLRRSLRVELEDGVRFTVEPSTQRRRATGNEMIRATIRRGGAPMRNDDLYREEPKITVMIDGRCRADISVNFNGAYIGPGRTAERSLRSAVLSVVRFYCPERNAEKEPDDRQAPRF